MSEPASRQDEYHDALIDMLELIWGRGFMIPDGPRIVRRIVAGVDLVNRTVLDIGPGIGGPALLMAGEMGADQMWVSSRAMVGSGLPAHVKR